MQTNTSRKERRRHERLQLHPPLAIFSEDKNTLFGRATNISPDGILINTDTVFNTETLLSLWLELTDSDGSPSLIPMQCTTKWSWQDTETDQFHLGCCFLEIDTEDLADVLASAREKDSH